MELSLCVLEVHCIARCSLIRLPHRKLNFSKNRNVCLLKARMLLLLLSCFSRVRLLATPWTETYQAPPQELDELELRPLSLILFKSVAIWR